MQVGIKITVSSGQRQYLQDRKASKRRLPKSTAGEPVKKSVKTLEELIA
jgi:hypothetical protein